LTACCYLTDETRLVYVLEVGRGRAVIEDASTFDITCVPSARLEPWRRVTPERADA
jgi:hypothetical protein